MRKWIVIFIAVLLVFSVAACGEKSDMPELGENTKEGKPAAKTSGGGGTYEEISGDDLPADAPDEVQELIIILPDGSEAKVTRDDVINSGKLVKQSQTIIQKDGTEVVGEFIGIKVKDLLALKGYSGGATSFYLTAATGNERDLHESMTEADDSLLSLARDGKWNFTADAGTFQFVFRDESPKDVWLKQTVKIELNK